MAATETAVKTAFLVSALGHHSYTIFSYENRRPSYERESNVNFDLAIFRCVTVYNVCCTTDYYVCQCKYVLLN